MNVEIQINNSAAATARYVTWAPSVARIRLSNIAGAPPGVLPVPVTVTAKASATGGDLVFFSTLGSAAKTSLSLHLPRNGNSTTFLVAGKFGRPSLADSDVSIIAKSGTKILGLQPLMVRIRKDASQLTAAERDRFVAAFAQLNNQGTGRFADFRNMHVSAASPEAHGGAGFLPWHRAYLLDLERELQNFDPSVALPYWRFDRPAPGLFAPAFLGSSDSLGTVSFSPTNPLQFWATDGVQGINRRPFFNITTGNASGRTEAQTLAIGSDYASFRSMEGNPHGSAHTSFGGSISSIPTAAKDPLFFLLHANVDRLWAKWQRTLGRFDSAAATSFDSNGVSGNRVGHNLDDTMWPWNGIITPPRPSTAPGGALAGSVCVSAPGPQPRVRDCLDYQGTVANGSRMGFDYDDVRFA
jgi:tyrosinase